MALIGTESDIYWARLSDVQVAVQIPLAEARGYWRSENSTRAKYHALMTRSGAQAIVSSWTNPSGTLGDWKRIEGTEYSVSPLTTKDDVKR